MAGPAKQYVEELLKLPADVRSEAAEALLISVDSQLIWTPEAGSSQNHSPPGGLTFSKPFPPAAA